jgi:hypothetical protein
MTLHAFKKLRRLEKARAISEGTYIIHYETAMEKVFLYKLADFYVEIVYDLQARDISSIRTSRTIKHLDLYIQHIDITTLLSYISK